ncbi:hypothetical protein LTR56_011017 [Elasticomyces elasticus]|nr:hypothetical protein LTR22_019603 [Elasticomyces elasticus]KAK3641916.1 hypothetical protein LTR56_011017 [Elasticomyces elasticus]KAK4905922.1 hypothetical protein LTR49_024841 [Elasticomyces elasticus]KAK5757488.1 hypothetical protein LTS12_012446 [Elasticomyces elasticus]
MPNFNTIAPELRLHIYEHVLRFDAPLKRTLFDRLLVKEYEDNYELPEPANTAILSVCRQVHDEALPVFYKVNTIWICHSDVCLGDSYTRTSLSCVKKLIVHARMTHNPRVCEDGPQYPRLRTITVDSTMDNFDDDYWDPNWWFACESVEKHLRESGAEVTYTGLARLTITLAATTAVQQQPTIKLRCAAAAQGMDNMLKLSKEELEARTMEGLFERHEDMLSRVCITFARAHAQLPLSADQRMVLGQAGLRCEDFDGQTLSSAMYRKMTSALG